MMRKELNWLGIVIFLIVIGLCAEWKRRALNESSQFTLATHETAGDGSEFSDPGSQNLIGESSSGDKSTQGEKQSDESESGSAFQLQSAGKGNQTASGGRSSSSQGVGSDASKDPRFPNRLSNSSSSLRDLSKSQTGILLRNALIDTSLNKTLDIPDRLKASSDTRSFLVQSKSEITSAFRNELEGMGAKVVAYVPNNAYLVQMDESSWTGVDSLKLSPSVQAAIPFEPYFKLDTDLLEMAVQAAPLPDQSYLNLTLFPDAGQMDWEKYGFHALQRSRSPFGDNVVLQWTGNADVDWTELARLEQTQAIEFYYPRTFANDLGRVRLGVAINGSTNEKNHLELTGKGITLSINDSGVDITHPDMVGRVFSDLPTPPLDLVGHGTHVAGTMIGNGSESASVTNIPPGSEAGFDLRGMAPEANLFSSQLDLDAGPLISDTYLHETTANYNYNTLGRSNPIASNNSWGYGLANEYNSSAASFDAAVRDALINQEGDQPIIYVFAAGNDGFGNDSGLGGEPNSISSPATAKNVITVGAIENYRELTNMTFTTNLVVDADGEPVLDENDEQVTEVTTNELFATRTDSLGHVASYSSRGNVGLGQEGDFGRFKPDLVAPGTFVISTRSADWEFDESGPSSTDINRIEDQSLLPAGVSRYTFLLPSDVQSVSINVLTNRATEVNLNQILVVASRNFPPEDAPEFSGPGSLNFTPPASSVWYYALINNATEQADFDIETRIARTQPGEDDEIAALKEMNDALGDHYRYETGTSMSAPMVTGMIGLIQEFFETRLQQGYSPALIKALLINGARSAGPLYDFQVNSPVNLQGWGTPDLENSLPQAMDDSPGDPSSWPVRYFDRRDNESLITGESHAYRVRMNDDALDTQLRVSLVWTDPPGNPLAGIKLVNDLDLVVSNVVSGDVYIGNNFPFESDFTESTSSEDTENLRDFVNNVENVFIRGPFDEDSRELVVFVRGARVNVNAVRTHEDGIAQDYALVISTGDTTIDAPFEITPLADPGSFSREVVSLSNDDVITGRVGANSPLQGDYRIGQREQWNLYEFTVPTSDAGDNTNVAFVTFVPPNLSKSRSTEQADIDLYVSLDPALHTLSQAALDASFKSIGPRGTEAVAFTNGLETSTYYIAIKSEDYQGGEFKLLSSASNIPFSQCEGTSCHLIGRPFGSVIPDGSPEDPGEANPIVFIASPADQLLLADSIIQNVTVTNIMTHQSFGDLLGNLSFENTFSVLHNHSIPDPLRLTDINLEVRPGEFENFSRYVAVYDDSGAGNILSGQPTDGPGSLIDFAGVTASGVWLFSVIDNTLTGEPGSIDRVDLRVDVTSPNGIVNQQVTILPNRFERNVVRVPPGATSLDVTMSVNGPINLYIRRDDIPTPTEFDKQALIDAPGGSLSLGVNDIPPLSPGTYHLLFVNPSGANVDLTYSVDVEVDAATIEEQVFESLDTVKILADQARTTSTIFVDEDRILSDIKAAVRIDHPRVSDLAIRLVGPDGQKILLSEHRGGDTPAGYGDGSFNEGIIFTGFTMNTNLSQGPIKFAAPPYTAQGVSTNVVETDFEDIEPRLYVQDEFVDGWEVRRDDVEVVNDTAGAFNGDQYLLLNNGRIRLPVPTIPGLQYELQFAYRSSVQDEQVRLILELPNGLVISPVSDTLDWLEIAPAVFTAQSNAGVFIEVTGLPANAFMAVDYFRIRAIGGIVYYTPEESLNEFLESGISSLGRWQLEVDDEREGALGGEGLLSWQLRLGYAPLPIDGIELFAETMVEGTLEGAETHYYYIDTPRSATTSINNLTGLTGADVMMLRADRRGFPVGSPSNDEYSPEFTPAGGGSALLIMNDDPPPNTPLIPGQRYFLAVENVDTATTNSYSLEVRFDATDPNEVDVPELTLGTPVTSDVVPGLGMDYYKVRISDEATEATFELTDLSGDADLYIRRATDSITPLPTILDFDWAGIQSGQQDETLQLTLQSQPPLDPGLWYIGVLNNEIQPITYTLTVNEVLPDPVAAPLATPTLVNGNTALLTWESVAGQTYVVETSSDLVTWAEMSVTTATGQTSTASESIADFIATGTGARFYRVRLIESGQQ